jgi:hypothetical protein
MKRLSSLWLTQTPTYFIISYGNVMFDLHPLSQQHNQGIKQGLPVYLKIS